MGDGTGSSAHAGGEPEHLVAPTATVTTDVAVPAISNPPATETQPPEAMGHLALIADAAAILAAAAASS